MSVWLGLCGESLSHLGEDVGWWTNKIGGSADWMKERPPRSLVTCNICGKALALVVQLYAPLEGSIHHRTLYILACTTATCWNQSGSWCVLRGQLPDNCSKANVSATAKSSGGGGLTSWCDGQDDWGTGQDDWGTGQDDWCADQKKWGDEADALLSSPNNKDISEVTTPAADKESVSSCPVMSLSESKHPSEQASECVFCSYYIDVVEEPRSHQSSSLAHEKKLAAEYAQRESVSFSSMPAADKSSGRGEQYEKVAQHGDVDFHRFHKCLRAYPQQIIRYKWKGMALPISDHYPLGDVPLCQYCGADCVFEVQLMPPLVSLLEAGEDHVATKQSRASKSPVTSLLAGKEVTPDYMAADCCKDSASNQSVCSASMSVDGDEDSGDKDVAESNGDVLPEMEVNKEEIAALASQLQRQCIDDVAKTLAVEFGTVVVFSCSESCWLEDSLFRCEIVIVSPDPDHTALKQLGLTE